MNPALRAIAVLCLTLGAGCAELTRAQPEVPAQAGPRGFAAPLVELEQRVAVAAPPAASAMKEEPAVEVLPPAVEKTPRSAIEKAIAPPAQAPAKPAALRALVEEPRRIEIPVSAPNAAVAKAPEPTLDLAGLTARLRDTKAIGVLTKLALSNQVDDLLKLLRVQHERTQESGVASLRPRYDMLVLKVLAVVQDGDPSLARTISGSREAIWGILADRAKFKSVT